MAAMLAVTTGCVSTGMTAPDARVPILLGPVGCIGCVARPPDHTAARWRQANANVHSLWVPIPNLGGYSRAKVVPFDELLAAHSCTEDFPVSALRASSWALHVPLIVYVSDLSIDAEVTRTTVPGGTCLPPP